VPRQGGRKKKKVTQNFPSAPWGLSDELLPHRQKRPLQARREQPCCSLQNASRPSKLLVGNSLPAARSGEYVALRQKRKIIHRATLRYFVVPRGPPQSKMKKS
jgi:hypothetical protein